MICDRGEGSQQCHKMEGAGGGLSKIISKSVTYYIGALYHNLMRQKRFLERKLKPVCVFEGCGVEKDVVLLV